MVSDERLEQLSKINTCFGTAAEMLSVASELLALRKAISEPVAFIIHAPGGDQLTFDGNYAANCEGNGWCGVTNLCRKPTRP